RARQARANGGRARRHLAVDLLDPGIAMANACASVTVAVTAEACRNLVRVALELVFAETGCVCIREAHSFIRPIASTLPDLPPSHGTPSLPSCASRPTHSERGSRRVRRSSAKSGS